VQPDPQGATSSISSGSLIPWKTMKDVRYCTAMGASDGQAFAGFSYLILFAH
jgi:hypothetical protein